MTSLRRMRGIRLSCILVLTLSMSGASLSRRRYIDEPAKKTLKNSITRPQILTCCIGVNFLMTIAFLRLSSEFEKRALELCPDEAATSLTCTAALATELTLFKAQHWLRFSLTALNVAMLFGYLSERYSRGIDKLAVIFQVLSIGSFILALASPASSGIEIASVLSFDRLILTITQFYLLPALLYHVAMHFRREK